MKSDLPLGLMIFVNQLILEVELDTPKYALNIQTYGSRFVGYRAPIPLKPNDLVWLDLRKMTFDTVELVERDGIIVWRADWRN